MRDATHLSHHQAERYKRMNKNRAPIILVDRNVLYWTVPIRPAVPVTKQVDWGGTQVTCEMRGFTRKTMDDSIWSQARCLPTIARLARQEIIVLATYNELMFEGMHAGETFKGSSRDLLRDVTFRHVEMAVERSYFQQTSDFKKHVCGKTLEDFIREFLLPLNEESILKNPTWREKLPESQLTNLANLQRFRALCKGLTPAQTRDAMHLWTAEVNRLDYFLTMDKRFINRMMKSKKGPFPCEPVHPMRLLERLGVEQLDPFPIPEDEYIPYMEIFREP